MTCTKQQTATKKQYAIPTEKISPPMTIQYLSFFIIRLACQKHAHIPSKQTIVHVKRPNVSQPHCLNKTVVRNVNTNTS